jgi:hypothetical protein
MTCVEQPDLEARSRWVGHPSQADFSLQGTSSRTQAHESFQMIAATYAAFHQTVKPSNDLIIATDSGVSATEGKTLDDRQLARLRLWLTLDDNARNVPRGLSGVTFSPEAISFCLGLGIIPELSSATDLLRSCFSVVGKPFVGVMEDPETEDTRYVIIEIQVRGGVKDNVLAHKKFASEAARLLGSKREIIRLHYSII